VYGRDFHVTTPKFKPTIAKTMPVSAFLAAESVSLVQESRHLV
jgi:hypothetical protein